MLGIDINSGCIGINITRNQDTAVPIGVNLSLKALINLVFTIVQIPLNPP